MWIRRRYDWPKKETFRFDYFLLFSFFLSFFVTPVELNWYLPAPYESWSIFSINLIFYLARATSFDDFWLDEIPFHRNGILLSIRRSQFFEIHFATSSLEFASKLHSTRLYFDVYLKKKKEKCFIPSYYSVQRLIIGKLTSDNVDYKLSFYHASFSIFFSPILFKILF